MDTHKPLNGIEIGDIGPKWGYGNKDNGFMAFNNVRVPKDSLLAKYTYIDESGNFKTRGNLKLLYASMMSVRERLLVMSSYSMLRACLIAVRYSNVRSQFKMNKTQERVIIDYQTQRSKIYPYIAKVYVMYMSYKKIKSTIQKNLQQVQQNDFSLMKEVHLLLCGAKAMYTQWTNDSCISLIQACGGHGYLMSAGIGPVLQTVWPNVILEGENTVLLLQVARDLLKSYQKTVVGDTKGLVGSLKYLVDFKKYLSWDCPSEKSKFRSIGTYMDMLCSCVIKLVQKSATKLQGAMGDGMSPVDAFDKVAA